MRFEWHIWSEHEVDGHVATIAQADVDDDASVQTLVRALVDKRLAHCASEMVSCSAIFVNVCADASRYPGSTPRTCSRRARGAQERSSGGSSGDGFYRTRALAVGDAVSPQSVESARGREEALE